jgi:hypothetical protein
MAIQVCAGGSVRFAAPRYFRANAIGLSMGSLDQPDRFQPTEHIWVSAKQGWLHLDDGLPQYPEAAP